MTQEDNNYKEKYERALEVMREWVAPCHTKEQLDVLKKTVFSELAESEDERIRKGLIEVLKTSKTVGELKFILPEPTREECIAWLEKQKEQKDYHKLYDDIAKSEWFKKAYEGKSLGYDDEQKEQNPVPSRETILGIWELGNFWKENPEERGRLTQLQYIRKYWTEKCDYQKEQKPAECELEDAFKDYTDAGITISCGDMIASPAGKPLFKKGDWVVYDGILGHGILQVKDIKAGRYTFVDNESSLLAADSDKYLRPLTPKDLIKPAEWSEEDEKNLELVTDCIYKFYPDPVMKYEIKDWLKSLRPSWKPSEEQIYSLGTVVKGMGYISEGSTGYHLKELYEQLKKLI